MSRHTSRPRRIARSDSRFFPSNRQRVPQFADDEIEGSREATGQLGCSEGFDARSNDFEDGREGNCQGGRSDCEAGKLVFELAGVVGVNPDPLTLRHYGGWQMAKKGYVGSHLRTHSRSHQRSSNEVTAIKARQLHPLRKSQGGLAFDGETMRAISES